VKVFGPPVESNIVAYGIISDYEISEVYDFSVEQIKMTCNFCDYGIDLSISYENIETLAFAIAANAHQAGQVILNTTEVRPGAIISYDDLWRFSLVNYHAGPKCLGDVIFETYVEGELLSYDQVSNNLSEGCITALDYVDAIAPIAD